MKAECPRDPMHDRFITVAHEVHEGLVNKDGDFLEDKGVY